MATVKKVIIPSSQLPAVTSENEYNVRFRIVSDDLNRRSHWSPTIVVAGNPIQTVPGATTYADGIVNVVWDDVQNFPQYDIFVKFDNDVAGFAYHGTSSVHNYSFINEATTQIDIIVQVASIEKAISAELEVYQETLLV